MKPSVGRVVHFWTNDKDGDELYCVPALIVQVWSDTCVNLDVFLRSGNMSLFTSAVQQVEGEPFKGSAWSWPERV